jgi:hypothetical protein
MDWIAGAAIGLGLGVLLDHFLVARPLMTTIARMRYAGFMGAEPPTPPELVRPTVRED